MVTRGKPRQIKGVNYETLERELAALHQNIGYFIGEVRYTADLATLSPKIGNVAFVQEDRKWMYWNGIDWIATQGGTGGPASSQSIYQVTKLDLDGLSPTTPKIVDIQVPYAPNFQRSSVEVLKFKPGVDNVVSTVFDFVNTDKDDFNDDQYIEFTGDLSLKTRYERPMVKQQGAVSAGELYTIPMNVNEFLKINSVTVR